jgi:hypothetical protein
LIKLPTLRRSHAQSDRMPSVAFAVALVLGETEVDWTAVM